MTGPSDIEPPEVILQTLGAIEIGVLLASVLYGVMCVQAYNYAMHTISDQSWIRYMVGFVVLLETLELVFAWAFFFDLSILRFGGPLRVADDVPWSFTGMVTTHGLCACIVQMFFAWRVYRVTRKTWLSLPAAIGAVIRSTFAALCGILVPVKGFESFKIKFGWMFYLALSLSTAVDVWVTASLCYHLWNRRTAYNSTRDKIGGIITWTTETCLVVCVTSVFIMISWAIWSTTMTWLCLVMVYGHMYATSLLVSLNARDSHKKWGSQGTHASSIAVPQTSVNITQSYHLEMSDLDGGRRTVAPNNLPKADRLFGRASEERATMKL